MATRRTPKPTPEPRRRPRPKPATSGRAPAEPVESAIAAADLAPLQERAVEALLTHQTIKAAARAARVGERTLRRWLKTDLTFLAAYRTARRAVVENAVSALQVASLGAVKALKKNLAAKSARAADQIRAAVAILKLAGEGVERFDQEQRLAALEERVAGLAVTAAGSDRALPTDPPAPLR